MNLLYIILLNIKPRGYGGPISTPSLSRTGLYFNIDGILVSRSEQTIIIANPLSQTKTKYNYLMTQWLKRADVNSGDSRQGPFLTSLCLLDLILGVPRYNKGGRGLQQPVLGEKLI